MEGVSVPATLIRMEFALVTGASRGVGRGVAIALAEAGFRVYATGRIVHTADLPGRYSHSLRPPAGENRRRLRAHRREADGLDALVNAAWGGYERMVEDGRFTWQLPFWERPAHRWTSMLDAGVRAAWVASSHAARMMVKRRSGLIVNIGYGALANIWPTSFTA